MLIEAEENSIGLTKAQYQQEAANKKYNDTVARMNELWNEAAAEAEAYNKEYYAMTDAANFLTQEYYDLQNALYSINGEIYTAEQSAKNYQKAMEEDQEAVAAAEEEIALAEAAVENLTAAMRENSGGAVEQEQALQDTVVGTMEKVNELATAYQEAYEAAYDSISGQYALWEEAAPVVATSIGDLNTALSSQVDYWQDYNNNLQSLIDRSGEIEGLRDMLASYADGSQESANAIAGLAGATDQQLQTMVSNWQALHQEQGKVAGSMADLKTDFNTFVEEMQENLAAKIEAMNLSEEAAESAEQTIQGFIDGANSMLPQVQAAYAGLARTARNALSPSGGGLTLNIPGYASGTQRAAPGLALVGEQGPELVYFGGGEQVMTAAETAALQARLSVSGGEEALPGAGGSVHLGGVQVVFQITGAPAPAVVEELRAYGDDFALRVLEVLENAQIDAKRGSMV